MSKNKFVSFRSQILNQKIPEGLIRIYYIYIGQAAVRVCYAEGGGDCYAKL